MRFHAGQPRPRNFSTCSLHSFRASPAAIFLPRVAGWHGCRRLVTPVDGLHLETQLRKFRRRGGRLVSGWKQLSDTNYQLSLSSSLCRGVGRTTRPKLPAVRILPASSYPELTDVQIAEPLSEAQATPVPCLPSRWPSWITNSETKIVPLITPLRFSC